MTEKILILDFGSQYTQLIARRLRELNVYSEIHPFYHVPALSSDVKGVILSGSPCSVNDPDAPNPDLSGIMGKVPVLGVCYGAQWMAWHAGGTVSRSAHREYGRAQLHILPQAASHPLFAGMSAESQVWMSHGDTITAFPPSFKVIAQTDSIPMAAFAIDGEPTYGIQFHPEVYHTAEGLQLLKNFITHLCGCACTWTPVHFIESTVSELRNTLGNDKVVMGLSGGVDSSVAALLLKEAIGSNLTCLFVDNGLLRKNEYEQVLEAYQHSGLNIIGVRAADRFLDELSGVSEPEAKRKIIGRVFIEVFEEEARKLADVKWLGQGTIYPDVIESVSVKGPSQTIKSHHNVGGLPEKMNLKIVEPLKLLFKDEVRRVGLALGLDPDILARHPFPGPGLAIRILGEITRERVALLQDADAIFIQGLKSEGLYDQVWQAGAIFLPVKSVGVMGDERTYEHVICLRAVGSTDGMTADWSHLPYEFLGRVSNQIINRVKGINRVVFDISSKPPATIEWE